MATKYGQELIFNATATGTDLVYVWQWWDGTVSVTSTNVVSKVANRWGVLSWSVTAVDALGQRNVYTSTVTVDRPPEFLSISLSKNNDLFPYVTQLSALLTGSQYPISCTFNGSGTTVAAGTQNVLFDMTVSSSSTQVLLATDSQGVASSFEILLFGGSNQPPVATSPSLIPHQWRVNSLGTLVTIASDPEGDPLTFVWTATASEGWSPSVGTSNGTSTIVGNGTQNVLIVDTTGQTIGDKFVLLAVTDTHGALVSFSTPVEVVQNSGPVIVSTSAFPTSAYVGDAITFSGTATDADNDFLTYRWNLSGPISGSATQYSRSAVISATGIGSVASSLTVTDRYGGSATSAGPTVSVN
jgi:hypothetical protein